MTDEDKPQTEEDRKAQEAIDALLSPEMGEALVEAADGQYVLYAPLLGAENHHRGQQAARVAVEFGLGAPTKLYTYWREAIECLMDHPDQHKIWGSVAMMVFFPMLAIVSLPLGVGYFARAGWAAFYQGIIKREVTFIPKRQFRERLTRKE